MAYSSWEKLPPGCVGAGGARDGLGNLVLATSSQGLSAIGGSPDAAKFLLKRKRKERRKKLFRKK